MKYIEIQSIWEQEVEARASHFGCIAFAIFYPGYGTHNIESFREAFKGLGGDGACCIMMPCWRVQCTPLGCTMSTAASTITSHTVL